MVKRVGIQKHHTHTTTQKATVIQNRNQKPVANSKSVFGITHGKRIPRYDFAVELPNKSRLNKVKMPSRMQNKDAYQRRILDAHKDAVQYAFGKGGAKPVNFLFGKDKNPRTYNSRTVFLLLRSPGKQLHESALKKG